MRTNFDLPTRLSELMTKQSRVRFLAILYRSLGVVGAGWASLALDRLELASVSTQIALVLKTGLQRKAGRRSLYLWRVPFQTLAATPVDPAQNAVRSFGQRPLEF